MQWLFAGSTMMLLVGCASDYRIQSVISTKENYATTWEESYWRHTSPFRAINNPHDTITYINPYTYNPAYNPAYNPPNITNFDRTSVTNLNKECRQYLYAVNSLYAKASVYDTNNPGHQMFYRNQLQDAILGVVQESTEKHLAGLKSAENNGNLFLGAATLGLAGGATVASTTAARALAASATGTAGAQNLFNSQVYRQTFVESTIALIEKDQEDFLNVIRQRQTKDIVQYTVEAAIMDAREYEERGSFYHGMALLQAAVQNKLNGGTNLVAINQYTAPFQIISPSIIPVTNGVNSVTLQGIGFDLVNVSESKKETNNWVSAISVNSKNNTQMSLGLTITTNTNTTPDSLVIPYTENGSPKQAVLPIELKK
jgi:hypothetical protein